MLSKLPDGDYYMNRLMLETVRDKSKYSTFIGCFVFVNLAHLIVNKESLVICYFSIQFSFYFMDFTLMFAKRLRSDRARVKNV